MSYRPDSHNLDPWVETIREGFKRFHEAAQARLDAGTDYARSHIEDLQEVRATMLALDVKLSRLV